MSENNLIGDLFIYIFIKLTFMSNFHGVSLDSYMNGIKEGL